MQIVRTEVTPLTLPLKQPVRMTGMPVIESIEVVFVRLETRDGHNAWGCALAHPTLNGQDPGQVLKACQKAADMAPDLHPLQIEFSIAQLAPLLKDTPAALCAYDLAFHDLLGLAAGMPLYRLLGGYQHKIQTSATVTLADVVESVEMAQMLARRGFRMLKIKGGQDPDLDVQRIRAIHRALPELVLRLDADGGYTVEQALGVARAIGDRIEMLEQPTPAGDLIGLREVTRNSPVPVLADQSAAGPESALQIASHHYAGGLSIKVAACGGLRCARQIDSIARAAGLKLMVSCLLEPALMIAAGLHFALSSSNVRYGDLDGHLFLDQDPTIPGFVLRDGWLEASPVPGLGCRVELA
ncbi:MAG: dipeptide epimerase [Anaerolineales bacterium]|nr:dipeptide epimerase [Anaerolineales bacterium]